MGKLVLFLADGTTLDIPLDRDRTTIGRRAGTDLCLPYAAVSGEHAVVIATHEGPILEDLGSTNGTVVNGKRVSKTLLRDADCIDIGRQKLVYVADVNGVAEGAARRPAVRRSGRDSRPERGSPRVDAGTGGVVSPMPKETIPHAGPPQAQPEAPRSDTLLKVRSGPNAGRTLPLIEGESLIGRAGIQVAGVRRAGRHLQLVPIEGAERPCVNGVPISADGVELRPGDVIAIAGADLELMPPDVRAPD